MKTYVRILLLMLLAILGVFILVWFAGNPNRGSNGFVREFGQKRAVLDGAVSTNEALFRYLGEYKGGHLFASAGSKTFFVIDNNFSHVRSFSLKLPVNNLVKAAKDFMLDNEDISLVAFNYGTIYTSSERDTAYTQWKIHGPMFTTAIKISPTSLVVRQVDTTGVSLEFRKIDLSTNDLASRSDLYSEGKDLGFSTAGSFAFDSSLHKLFYVHFFSNKIAAFDTTLTLSFLANTIDTTQLPSLQTTSADTSKRISNITNTTPKRAINRSATCYKGNLYVLSLVKADNESQDLFDSNNVVDVYSCIDGKYNYSFYLEKPGHSNITSFKVLDDKIIAVAGHSAATYRFK